MEILYNGVIRKTVCQYDGGGHMAYVVENEDNITFRVNKERRDLLAPFDTVD